MRILFAASEAVPFIKTGGLADVAGALPKALRARGHDVRMVLPRYGDIDNRRYRLIPVMPELNVRYGPNTIVGSVLRCFYPGTDIPVYFIDDPMFSMRRGLYGSNRVDFPDNDLRFSFFNMAILWLLRGLDWQPNILHANDWQTGLLPVLIRHHHEVAHDPFYADMRTVFSVHNLAFQGNFDKFVLPSIGLPWEVFTEDGMEFFGRASFLKGGLNFSDEIVAVSPTYAQEIQQDEELGAGMDGTLRSRAEHLHGVLNGIDMEVWDPANDTSIAANFSAEDRSGKARCKEALQHLYGLEENPRIPLVGMVTRLSAQKVELVMESLEQLPELDAQFVFLGSGDPRYEEPLQQLAKAHPKKIGIRIGYDEPLSHKIIAGSDMFLVPSRFEPCGLTQFYSMRYGTVPVVRATGGLRDTVLPAPSQPGGAKNGTGFLFEEYTGEAFLACLKEAIAIYQQAPETWALLQENGMAGQFGWDRAAAEYEDVYRAALSPERLQ